MRTPISRCAARPGAPSRRRSRRPPGPARARRRSPSSSIVDRRAATERGAPPPSSARSTAADRDRPRAAARARRGERRRIADRWRATKNDADQRQLAERQVHLRIDRTVEAPVPHVARRRRRPRASPACRRAARACRPATRRPVAPRHRLVDDGHERRLRVVGRGELAAGDEPDAHRLEEVVERDGAEVRPRRRVGRRLAAFDPDAVRESSRRAAGGWSRRRRGRRAAPRGGARFRRTSRVAVSSSA